MGSYSDWDAAIDAQVPPAFTFMGERWELSLEALDYRDMSTFRKQLDASSGDLETAEIALDWLAKNCQDPARFRELAKTQKIPAPLIFSGLHKITGDFVGIDWDLDAVTAAALGAG
jgi:hypothetical protein